MRRFPGLVIVNVGTLFRLHDPCCAIIDFELGDVEFFDLNDAGELVAQGTTISLAGSA